jgi:type I restriction enzyme M protein
MSDERLTQAEIETHLKAAANLLRGDIDAGDYKQYIFPLLFYKRICDVYDEEYREAMEASGGDEEFAAEIYEHRFIIRPENHWNEVRKATSNVGARINKALRGIEFDNKDTLTGIFGDAKWTNKDRLTDETLKELIERFSMLKLDNTHAGQDELGNAYEFLIKYFADDSGHTAAEFYTNRTVIELMTTLLDINSGESVYDPTCGTGGMLMVAAAHLKRQGKEYRNLKLYGQEINIITSAVARMNLYLHGIEDFEIAQGDTLSKPAFKDKDKLRTFDVVLANPPYSIKQWDRKRFEKDPYKRNVYGVPPQGCADYAFFAHIIKSMDKDTGRCAILFPHGVLFRDSEKSIRANIIKDDKIECVIGLGANLFYNSPMEACIIICRSKKSGNRKGKILFINAVNEVSREQAQSFLTEQHIKRIDDAYKAFADEGGFAKVMPIDELRDYSLSIPLYVRGNGNSIVAEEPAEYNVADQYQQWCKQTEDLYDKLEKLIASLEAAEVGA